MPLRPRAGPGRHRQPPGARGARDRGKERAHLPTRSGATSQRGGQVPQVPHLEGRQRRSKGSPRVPLRATKAGSAGLVTSGYLHPFGAAGLVVELGAAWLERSRSCAQGPGGGEGRRGRGIRERKAKAERGEL